MGNFYVNFSVKSTDQAVIVAALSEAQRMAFVSPVIDGYVVVFDRDADEQALEPILSVGALLSQTTDAPVFAVLNHDDDVLLYWLFEHGMLTDEYNSDPTYGSDDALIDQVTPTSANLERVCQVLGVPDATDAVRTILYETDYLFVLDQHQALVILMELPLCTVGFGFNYIESDQDNLGGWFSSSDLIRIG